MEFGFIFLSLNFHYSSLITHYSSLNFLHSFGIITQFPSLNIFHIICGPIPVSRCNFFFSFVFFGFCFCFQYPNSLKLKKKKTNSQPRKERKKKSQKLRLVLFVGPLCVFNYNIAIELWVMEIENSQNVFSVSITHNSKIRELSDGNRVMETKLSFTKQPFCYGSHYFWIMNYENWELSYEIYQSKRPLNRPLTLLKEKITVWTLLLYLLKWYELSLN